MNIYEIKEIEKLINPISLTGVYSGWNGNKDLYFSIDFIDSEIVEVYFGKQRKTKSPAELWKGSMESIKDIEYSIDSIKNDSLHISHNYISASILGNILK
ncbi:MAG: hypothetical protein JXR82_02015 [Marinifilaceae bacterium]|nr:hypothetical protein [Marinifilaceae bacterium]